MLRFKSATERYNVAMAAGHDAGNRSMQEAGRERWNASDWDAAEAEARRILGEPSEVIADAE